MQGSVAGRQYEVLTLHEQQLVQEGMWEVQKGQSIRTELALHIYAFANTPVCNVENRWEMDHSRREQGTN